jgi:phosphate transport system permease protein
MTDIAAIPGIIADRNAIVRARLAKRYRAELRLKAYGIAAIAFAFLFLIFLLSDIVTKAWPAFTENEFRMEVTVARAALEIENPSDPVALSRADFLQPIRLKLLEYFPEAAENRRARAALFGLVSRGGAEPLRAQVVADPSLIGTTLSVPVYMSDDADYFYKGYVTQVTDHAPAGTATPSGTSGTVTLTSSAPDFTFILASVSAAAGATAELTEEMPSRIVGINGGRIKITEVAVDRISGETLVTLSSAAPAAPGAWKIETFEQPEANRKMGDQELTWLQSLKEKGLVINGLNWRFFSNSDSREAELAGILGALVGSAFTMLVTLVVCLPLGVGAAIYLEEFAPKNRFVDVIEVNINNLAAVPSIVFGLLGLAVFLGFFGLPRSAPLVGGLVLALLVLPTIIIAARAALKAVPPSIREGALGVGASHQQAVFHHVLPLAMPGILTGTIIGMAHALGESAPLLLIGMVAFIVDAPSSVTSAATVLPVQVFLWSDLPEIGFRAKTSLAIIVLLLFLFAMNGLAIFLRSRFEKRW